MSEKTEQLKVKRKTRLSDVRQSAKPKTAVNTVSTNRLEILVTVVERHKAEYYMDLIQAFEVNMQAMVLARGTADAKTLRVLGLSDSEKVVIFSIIQQNRIKDALGVLEFKFRTIKDGKGIAYTIPMTSVIGTLIYGFLSNNRAAVKESK